MTRSTESKYCREPRLGRSDRGSRLHCRCPSTGVRARTDPLDFGIAMRFRILSTPKRGIGSSLLPPGGWLVTSITGFPSDVAARCCTPSVRHEASHGRGLQQSPRHTTENPFAHAAVAISTANNEIGALFAGDVKDFISGFV